MNVEKRNKIFAGICYICAIICMVALLICAIVLSKEVPSNVPGTPPTTSSSAPELDGDNGAGDNNDSVVVPQTNTKKVLELIFNSNDFYVYPWANAMMSDLTFNSDFVNVESISEPFEIAASNFLAEIHAKLGFVSEITIDVLDDDGINNTYEILLNLIYDNIK